MVREVRGAAAEDGEGAGAGEAEEEAEKAASRRSRAEIFESSSFWEGEGVGGEMPPAKALPAKAARIVGRWRRRC